MVILNWAYLNHVFKCTYHFFCLATNIKIIFFTKSQMSIVVWSVILGLDLPSWTTTTTFCRDYLSKHLLISACNLIPIFPDVRSSYLSSSIPLAWKINRALRIWRAICGKFAFAVVYVEHIRMIVNSMHHNWQLCFLFIHLASFLFR